MKKLYIISLLLFLLVVFGCEAKIVSTEPISEVVKATIPFDEREFIYNNGIMIEQKEVNSVDEKKIKVLSYYPIISGLKDKSIQDKINKELEEVPIRLLTELESSVFTQTKDKIQKHNQKSTSAFISYNSNNVIFVEYTARLDLDFNAYNNVPNYKDVYIGYDLNTGKKVELADIFKPDTDYKTKINNFICQYIIENNYDDYVAERMSRPFQGIREDQSFTFGYEGLRIVLDEKNDEFFNYGYSDQILIPLKCLGDDLYIFDRYFDENKNIFEKDKLIKKLLPNKIEFQVSNIIEESNEKCFISITQGQFINVPNKDIEKKLNDMSICTFDVDGFKERAKNYIGANGNSNFGIYGHYINLFTNAGGYISMAVSDEIRIGKSDDSKRTPFNYNFKRNKEMSINDIFVEGTNVGKVIKSYIRKLYYPIAEEMVSIGVDDTLKANIFYFDEYGITVYFSPEGAKLESYQNWVYIPFEEFGIENINLFN
jgi:hypothetical protein